MDKSVEFTWTIKGGKNVPQEEIKRQVQEGWQTFVGKVEQVQSDIEPPKTLREFEDRLGEYLESLYEQTFGRVYYLTDSKMLRNDTSVENLVHVGIECHRFLQEKQHVAINKFQNGYKFLKIALEKNYPFNQIVQPYLGVFVDLSGLSLPQKNEIAIQCAAHVIWHIDGKRFPTIEAMIQRLRKKEDPLFDLLELERFSRTRTLRDWIDPVYPIPPEQRKKGRSKRDCHFNDLIPIPGIHVENKVNYLKLRFATLCLTRILRLFDWDQDKIAHSKILEVLQNRLVFYPRMYVIDWVVEAYTSNGRIFDL